MKQKKWTPSKMGKQSVLNRIKKLGKDGFIKQMQKVSLSRLKKDLQ